MHIRVCAVVLACVAIPAGKAHAQGEQYAAAIADRYLAAMQRKGYAFLSNDELSGRREQVAAFAVKYLHQPLDEATRAAVLEGIDHCIDRLYSEPASKVDYGNGFGSGGEEWMYLNDRRDYFLTFQYHLWFGLTHQSLAPAEAARRDTQRQWMREYLAKMPHRGIHETPPRVGMSGDDARPWALAELEKAFADPLALLSERMPDAGFAQLQDRFKRFSNGIAADFHDMQVAALDSRIVCRQDPAGRFGRSYSGEIPFDDTVVNIWGNGPSLHFASNADFRGNNGMLGVSTAYDVVRSTDMRADPPPAPTAAAIDAWLTAEGRGELALVDSNLIGVRGAKIAELPVKNWFQADKLSDDQLRATIRDGSRDQISIKRLPRMNGPQRGDRSQGEFFVVVQNRENHVAVINLHNYEFGLEFWCRPRTEKKEEGSR